MDDNYSRRDLITNPQVMQKQEAGSAVDICDPSLCIGVLVSNLKCYTFSLSDQPCG